ncbi:MAG: tetratricopeptide repeat protein [Acidobacteria bacterium]|nr:tetratricopeptide repeat protein [Acidobacteriota bacterium]
MIPTEIIRVLQRIDIGSLSVRKTVSRELSQLDEKTLLTLPEIVERALGVDHPELAKALHRLAVLYHSRDNMEKAEFLYRRALDTAERAFSEPNMEWGLMMNNFGRALYDQKKFTEAEVIYKQAINLLRLAIGPKHRKLATPLSNLGNLYRDQNQWELAESMYQSSIVIMVEALGPLHPRVVRAREKLAAVKLRNPGISSWPHL